MAEENPTLPDCNDDIYHRGSTVCVLHGKPNDTEEWVKLVAEKAGARMDWYLSDNGLYGIILYLGDAEVRSRILKAIRELQGRFRGLLIHVDAPAEMSRI